MSTLQERMEDAQFEMHTPICQFCLNMVKKAHPNGGKHLCCTILGEVPKNIKHAESTKCHEFYLNVERWSIYQPLMPEDFDPKTITD